MSWVPARLGFKSLGVFPIEKWWQRFFAEAKRHFERNCFCQLNILLNSFVYFFSLPLNIGALCLFWRPFELFHSTLALAVADTLRLKSQRRLVFVRISNMFCSLSLLFLLIINSPWTHRPRRHRTAFPVHHPRRKAIVTWLAVNEDNQRAICFGLLCVGSLQISTVSGWHTFTAVILLIDSVIGFLVLLVLVAIIFL